MLENSWLAKLDSMGKQLLAYSLISPIDFGKSGHLEWEVLEKLGFQYFDISKH